MRSIARFVSARRTAWMALVIAAAAVAALFAFLPKGEADACRPPACRTRARRSR
ncbi:hypothetical protein [Clavibacter michiganensis]|uniref:hypothetical protein n=1 Tax=Clavibacter michiganensis TaxID=28447 RepID=UPI003756F9C3